MGITISGHPFSVNISVPALKILCGFGLAVLVTILVFAYRMIRRKDMKRVRVKAWRAEVEMEKQTDYGASAIDPYYPSYQVLSPGDFPRAIERGDY